MRPARPRSRNNGGLSSPCATTLSRSTVLPGDAAALKRKAEEALEAEERKRVVEGERALGRAEAHWRKQRFQEAMLELERARGFSPNATALHAFEERLRESIARTERNNQLAREADEAIAAARRAFSSGQRDQALSDLQSFQARAPEPAIAAEISRLEAEAKRIATAEHRAAEAAQQAHAAEAALMAGNPEQALKLANVALAIDPSHPLAREVSGFASAELKQRAEKEARVATAARHLEEAKQHVGRGKFQKARALVSAATHLDPANNQYGVVLAWIHEEEARAAAEAERRILARRLAIAVAPILERAREAEAQRDYLRAAWTAENALAVDPECAEAKEIWQRAREQLEAQPQLADKTRRFHDGQRPVRRPRRYRVVQTTDQPLGPPHGRVQTVDTARTHRGTATRRLAACEDATRVERVKTWPSYGSCAAKRHTRSSS